MKDFEQCLEQFEPMISATMRKLHVYRDFEQFRQVGRIALWQAWERFDHEKGAFPAYASRSIWGAMLDYMKRENRFSDYVVQTEDEQLLDYVELHQEAFCEEVDKRLSQLIRVLPQLTKDERRLINWLYVDKITQKDCATKLGLSVPGVKKRRERTLLKLRNILEEKGLRSEE